VRSASFRSTVVPVGRREQRHREQEGGEADEVGPDAADEERQHERDQQPGLRQREREEERGPVGGRDARVVGARRQRTPVGPSGPDEARGGRGDGGEGLGG
jgi:hypothetical protein